MWARWAVERWAEFPVSQEPRPLVLVGPAVFVEHGFSTGEAKDAYLQRRFEMVGSVPNPVLETLRMGGSGSVPARALPAPLQITEATHSTAEFRTDRGRAELPAWRLTSPSARGPIWVLEPELLRTEWRPQEPPSIPRPDLQPPVGDPGAKSELQSDGRTLTVHVMGGRPEWERCTGAEIFESQQAVAVVPVVEDIGPPGSRTLAGFMHEVTVALRSPLGARVHVDLHGNPIEVCTTPG